MTTATLFAPALRPPRREWGAALRALRRLLDDKDDTEQVFEIMRALNGGASRVGYRRLLSSVEGGRLAYRRAELAPLLADRAALAACPPGSLGAAYRDFTDRGGISPEGLVAVSGKVMTDLEHPYAWYGRGIRDAHDLWHVVTGYGLDRLGEASLVAFSFAQTRGLGWALIGGGAALRHLRAGQAGHARAIVQGYRRGRAAAWLPAVDWPAQLGQPLDAVRARLRITPPSAYLALPAAAR